MSGKSMKRRLLDPLRGVPFLATYEVEESAVRASSVMGVLLILAYGKYRWRIDFCDGASTGDRVAWTRLDMRAAQWFAKSGWARKAVRDDG